MSTYSLATNGQLEPYRQMEWLLTNGLGAFASSTVVGCNTRRYHGLLVAATLPPVGRMVALSRLGEVVLVDGSGDVAELSLNQFPDSLHPRGDRLLRRFESGDSVRWEYAGPGWRLTKEVQLLWGRNTVGVRYGIEPTGNGVELRLSPFVAMRDFHSLRHGGPAPMATRSEAAGLAVCEGGATLHIWAPGMSFESHPDWWYRHVYAVETERGLDDREDLFTPGWFAVRATGPTTVTLWASLDEPREYDWDRELAARSASRPVTIAGHVSPVMERLRHAADDFVVGRKSPDGKPGVTIVAGYPWFSDWGRDTMIAMRGILLARGRLRESRDLLCMFAQYVSDGMIPNVFDDATSMPHYNTVDASLWFVQVAHEYLSLSKDSGPARQTLLRACCDIVRGYRQGTRFGIAMDADGLIVAGDASTQLTWMDAKCNDIAFTPRHGKAVEINALWYNALMLLGENELARKVRDSFVRVFWHNTFRGLFDVVHDGRGDAAIRPNQIFAVSLSYSPLDEEQQKAVVEVVRRELLTPFGLRTLARGEEGYRGRYEGGPFERDRAYHNGTVWPWLIGPFLDAWLRVNPRSPAACDQARKWLAPLLDLMNGVAGGCVGQINEIFDGDTPQRPAGCFAQAWSVGEVLRLAGELGL